MGAVFLVPDWGKVKGMEGARIEVSDHPQPGIRKTAVGGVNQS